MEVNGPANIVMILDLMFEHGAIAENEYRMLKVEALKTIEYMKRWNVDKSTQWSDVK